MSFKHPAPHAADQLATDLSRHVRQALFDAALGAITPGDQLALTVPRARAPLAPARLARSHPGGPGGRAQAQLLYVRCLRHYREAVRPQDDSHDNVGAAVARFVAANLLALHGVRASAETLLRLEHQLSGVARASSAWARAPLSERQRYFETMALLAVMVGELAAQALAEGAAAIAHVQRAARGYLQQLLGLNPHELTLTEHGLALRDTAAANEVPAASH
jgi:hypothetical protein